MDEILTSEQVANILQVHPFTVLKFIKQGKLKASKLGRVYRIRRTDVDAFLDNQVQQAHVPKTKTPKVEKLPKKKDQDKSKETKKTIRTARKDQKTPRSEAKAPQESSQANKVGPPIEVPTKEVTEKKEPQKRPDKNDSDHYKLKI